MRACAALLYPARPHARNERRKNGVGALEMREGGTMGGAHHACSGAVVDNVGPSGSSAERYATPKDIRAFWLQCPVRTPGATRTLHTTLNPH